MIGEQRSKNQSNAIPTKQLIPPDCGLIWLQKDDQVFRLKLPWTVDLAQYKYPCDSSTTCPYEAQYNYSYEAQYNYPYERTYNYPYEAQYNYPYERTYKCT